MKAVVVNKINDYSVVSVNLDPPKMGEVLVKMKATGVCHSDLSVINGTIPSPLPVVLGHEGAGIVDQVGEGVTNVKPGDHVVISFIPNCGNCFYCLHQEPYLCSGAKQDGNLFDGTTRVHRDGQRIFVMSFVGIMAEYAVVPAACLVTIDKSYDFIVVGLRRNDGCRRGDSHGQGATWLNRRSVRLRWRRPECHSRGAHCRRSADHRVRSLA